MSEDESPDQKRIRHLETVTARIRSDLSWIKALLLLTIAATVSGVRLMDPTLFPFHP